MVLMCRTLSLTTEMDGQPWWYSYRHAQRCNVLPWRLLPTMCSHPPSTLPSDNNLRRYTTQLSVWYYCVGHCHQKWMVSHAVQAVWYPWLHSLIPCQPHGMLCHLSAVRPAWRRILHRTSILLMRVLKNYYSSTTATDSLDFEKKTLKQRTAYVDNHTSFTQLITSYQNRLAERKQPTVNILLASSAPRCRHRRQRRRRKHKTISPSHTTPTTSAVTVITLSSVPVSSDEVTLLSRGLSYTTFYQLFASTL